MRIVASLTKFLPRREDISILRKDHSMSNNPEEKPESSSVSELKAKKPYTKPLLVVYGTVERITEASQNSGPQKDQSGIQNPENRSR
jgi:hypothetical protein